VRVVDLSEETGLALESRPILGGPGTCELLDGDGASEMAVPAAPDDTELAAPDLAFDVVIRQGSATPSMSVFNLPVPRDR
jgi:hypothetical protein